MINDGSEDESGNICDEYSNIDERIKVIHHKNRDLSAACNTGVNWILTNSNSQWLTFIDRDDWILPTYLESLYSAVKENKVLISASNYLKVEDEKIVEADVGKIRSFCPEKFYCTMGINATTVWGNYMKEIYFCMHVFQI